MNEPEDFTEPHNTRMVRKFGSQERFEQVKRSHGLIPRGAEVGLDASVGYTQADGTKSMKVPVLGEITVDLFKKPAFLFDTDCNQYNTVKSCDAIKGCAWSHFGCVRTSPRL